MGLLSSLLLYPLSPWPLRAAERLEVSIEGVVLPVEVRDLRVWVTQEGAGLSDLRPWMQLLDPESRIGVRQLLQAPVLTRRSFGEQVLRSWAAGPLLDAIGAVVRLVDGDRIGSDVVLATLEQLLQQRPQVSTLDLLEALPGQQLRLDLDGLVLAASRWRAELKRHQALMAGLSRSIAPARPLSPSRLSDPVQRLSIQLSVAHRSNPLALRLWKPSIPRGDRLWIALMPGLGVVPTIFSGWPGIWRQRDGLWCYWSIPAAMRPLSRPCWTAVNPLMEPGRCSSDSGILRPCSRR